MKQLFPLLFSILLLFSCKEKTEKISFSGDQDLYDVVNAYIKEVNATTDEPPFIVVVLEKTIPFKPITDDVPLPPGDIYAKELYMPDFQELLNQNIFNTKDVEYLKAQLPSPDIHYRDLPFYLLDSANIYLPVMTDLEYKYKGCYLAFSNPLFTEDKSKVYFQTSRMCGRLHGHGEIVVMEKSNDGWKIIYRTETWVS